jgi:hypothetical protein
MSESEPLAEQAKRLTQETYKFVAMARALRAKAEQLEKDVWKLLKEIESERDTQK